MKLATALLLALSTLGYAYASAQENLDRPRPVLSGRTFTGAGPSLDGAVAAATQAAQQAAQQAGMADFMADYVVEEIGGRRGGLLNLSEVTVRIRLR